MANKHCNISISEYHKNKATGRTTITSALKSARAYKRAIEGEFEMSASMALGDSVHAQMLEPDRFAKMYELSYNRSKEKELSPLIDIPKITASNYYKFDSMINALLDCPEYMELWNNRYAVEKSFFATINGREFKCRPDFITKDGWVVDLKTCGGMSDMPSSPESFAKSFYDYGYDVQLFMYPKIIEEVLQRKLKGMIFACVDAKKDDSGVKLYTFARGESQQWKIGEAKFNEGVEKISEYEKLDEFPVYGNVHEEDLMLSYMAQSYAVDKELI